MTMNARNNSIPYSQRRRFSNAATTTLGSQTASTQSVATKHTVILQVNDTTMGSVTCRLLSIPSSYTDKEQLVQTHSSRFSTVTSSNYAHGTVIRVVATPSSSNYVLDHFEDGAGNRLNSNTGLIDITVNKNMTVRAVFRKAVTQTQVELKVNWDSAKGDVEGVPALSKSGKVILTLGQSITLTARPKAGYMLKEWNGTWVAGKEQPKHNLTITEQILSNRTINAVFAVADVSPTTETPGDPLDPDPATDPGTGGGGSVPHDPLEPENPGTHSGGNGGYNPETPSVQPTDTLSRVKDFVKQWWWALAIVAYIVYKERKGGKR